MTGKVFDLDQTTPLTHFHFSNVSLFGDFAGFSLSQKDGRCQIGSLDQNVGMDMPGRLHAIMKGRLELIASD